MTGRGTVPVIAARGGYPTAVKQPGGWSVVRLASPERAVGDDVGDGLTGCVLLSSDCRARVVRHGAAHVVRQ